MKGDSSSRYENSLAPKPTISKDNNNEKWRKKRKQTRNEKKLEKKKQKRKHGTAVSNNVIYSAQRH